MKESTNKLSPVFTTVWDNAGSERWVLIVEQFLKSRTQEQLLTLRLLSGTTALMALNLSELVNRGLGNLGFSEMSSNAVGV